MSFYETLGGEGGVRALVDRFYDLMDTLPEAKHIREMHPAELTGSREKLFMFLSGWLGGPNLFIEKFGHPRLRARHMPFPIDDVARDQWMLCMGRALDELCADEDARARLKVGLQQLADHMRNA
jgi:hemoglobin